MSLRITLAGGFDVAISSDLQELADKLKENGIQADVATLKVPGVKVELAIGIAIASLGMSSVNTLIAVINFWRGQKAASYRLTLDAGTVTKQIGEADLQTMKDAVEAGTPVSLVIEKI